MPPEASAPGVQGLADLPRLIQAAERFAPLAQGLRAGLSGAVDGAWGSSAALAVAALAREAPSSVLIVIAHPGDLDSWVADIASLTGDRPVEFPAIEGLPGESQRFETAIGDRLRVVQRLATNPPPVIFTTIQSLLQPVPDRAALAARTRTLRIGDTLDLDEFSAWLVEHGYRRLDAIEAPGEFARRGGILDIYSPDADAPYRLELFGDEIESLRQFSPETQRSLGEMQTAGVLALTEQSGSGFRASGVAEPNTRNPIPDRGHLTQHLPPNTWIFLIEPADIQMQGQAFRARAANPIGLFSLAATMEHLTKYPSVTISALPTATVEAVWHMRVESVERFSGNVAKLRDELDSIAATETVLIACHNDAEAKRLGEVLAHGKLAESERLKLVTGHVHAGYRLVEPGVIVLGSHELFHRAEEPGDAGIAQRVVRRKIESRAIDSFLDLAVNDLVVHVSHGIARFRGMVMLDDRDQGSGVRGQTKTDESSLIPDPRPLTPLEEHLLLEFRGGVMVYVPASKIDLVQKYVGGSKSEPELSKFGGTGWARKKEKVAEAVHDLAADMLQMQALRAAQPGIDLPPDTDWQLEFEASFPYQETPDQITSLREIKSDMQKARPMDRLLCGDVGYGKTELAVRAAFKTIDNGRQVAVLVPTTVLAEQHYRTFSQRLAEYPFVVEVVSRFKTQTEQKRVLERVANGEIDVIVGTHRLVSDDVRFKDLGLVIIDEEQRFGVEHKEKLKRLRAMVDVLTLTATPIPRTLHLALLGIRDISNLETPPPERLPVETRITRFDKHLVRQAILREMNRDGQIFFVHNRVIDIYGVASELQSIVPEARIVVAHGQQPADELEEAMTNFVRREADVLVATTIIESGLDIPTANTIFIHEADRYGLADLHQLRGRVGRHKHRAYAYLLLDGDRTVTPEAARRLKAIEEFTELGAGFKIAIRDLEIRGAGNILGTQQSGHIAAVGYEMYCQLLEAAVRQQQQLPAKTHLQVNVDLPWPAYLPHDYVPAQKQRIEIYRRLARIRDSAKLDDFRQELRDRYGPMPEPAEWMLRHAEIRILAARWQIANIHRDGKDLVFTYLSPRLMKKLAERTGKTLRIADMKQAYWRAGEEEPMELFERLREVLRAN
jgi:transcription-repair coupling factor (superfamily II helicase)